MAYMVAPLSCGRYVLAWLKLEHTADFTRHETAALKQNKQEIFFFSSFPANNAADRMRDCSPQ